jgi:hypothetical protein
MAAAGLVVLVLLAVGTVVVAGSHLTFFNDDWYFLLQRPGLEAHPGVDALLAPHNGNAVILTALCYKVLVSLFGLSSQVPFRATLAVAIAAVGVLTYLYLRERVGPVLALCAAAIIMFLGPAWEDLLFFASIDIVGSLALGIGALVLLDQRGGRRDAWACVVLIGSVGFSNVGVPFAVAAIADSIVRRDPRTLWRGGLPLVLFAVWWLAYGHTEPSHFSATNVEHLPRYVIDSLAAGVASVTGLSRGTVPSTYTVGLAECVALALGTALRVHRRGWPSVRIIVPLTGVVTFWVLTGVGFYPGREAFASRYQMVDALFLLLIFGELLRGAAENRAWIAGGIVISLIVLGSNTVGGFAGGSADLAYGYRFLRAQGGFVKADLGALELVRNLAPPSLRFTAAVVQNQDLSGITAASFFHVTRLHGTPPTDSEADIAVASPMQRQSVDGVLATAEQLTPRAIRHHPTPLEGSCEIASNSPAGEASVKLSPGNFVIANPLGISAVVSLRRFAPVGLPTYVAFISAHGEERLRIPTDAIPRPWLLGVRGRNAMTITRLRVCRARQRA